MNKYYKMIDHMHMPEEQYEQLKASLAEQAGEKRVVRPVWRRYATAAALALCLLGTAVTTYAAVRNNWFQMFFDNGQQEAGIVEEIALSASTKEVTAQDDNYRFTVLSHAYSKEQQMGLVLCSFQFLKEQHTHFNIHDKAAGQDVVIKKNAVIDAQEFMETNTDRSERLLNFHVNGDFDKMLVSSSEAFYTGELAEDGGYLIGIRYSVSMQDAAGQEPELVMFLENAGDINDKLKITLPGSENLTCARFVSEQEPENFIDVSAIGMTLTMTAKKADHGYQDVTFDDEVLDSLRIAMGAKTMTYGDLEVGAGASALTDETDETYTWFVQEEFTRLLDISQIDYIELAGARYSK